MDILESNQYLKKYIVRSTGEKKPQEDIYRCIDLQYITYKMLKMELNTTHLIDQSINFPSITVQTTIGLVWRYL